MLFWKRSLRFVAFVQKYCMASQPSSQSALVKNNSETKLPAEQKISQHSAVQQDIHTWYCLCSLDPSLQNSSITAIHTNYKISISVPEIFYFGFLVRKIWVGRDEEEEEEERDRARTFLALKKSEHTVFFTSSIYSRM